MEMLLKSTVLMTWPSALSKVLWQSRLKGVTPEPMMRSTEYRAVAFVLLALLTSVFRTVTGLGAFVAAGTRGALVAAGAGLAVATAAVVAAAVATGAGLEEATGAVDAAAVAAGAGLTAGTASVEAAAVAAGTALISFVGGASLLG